MKPGFGLELVQTQKLSLTPEMRLSLAVLQMGAVELRDYILAQAEANPLIEVVDDRPAESLAEESPAQDDELVQYLEESHEMLPDLSRNREPRVALEALAKVRGVSLRDHLLAQVGVLSLSRGEYAAIEALIGSLDDNGYLRSPVGEIAVLARQPEETVARMLSLLQSLDPPGVGASDLSECLLLQAKAKGKSGLVVRVIETYLEDLAAARYRKIAKAEGVTLEEVLEARDFVVTLEPKPGASFSCDAVSYAVPEVSVRSAEGRMEVTIRDEAMPRLMWNSHYRSLASSGDEEARAYLARDMKSAQSLIWSIEQRKNTLTRVMSAIAAKQQAFFLKGPGHLRPLTLRDISEETGLHESTVSRAISNKYVDTPYGIFPCKSFFSPRVNSGEAPLSQDSVKAAIIEIVGSEDKERPLGDREISAALEKRGMRVARRTVAKYRLELGIMPAVKRKSV